MEIADIERKLLSFITSSFPKAGQPIGPDTSLEEIGLDSLSLVEMLVFIEKNFNLQLVESNISRDNLKSIRSLAAFIAGKL
ncbi:MAG: acyl carrier protein [Nitrospinota bacterium]|nr:acyl carrier protein [Nitrospinota bacterium]MDH5679693.1 acyl carrier protein [Nitrospinota bacterium]MDH5756205.1 acyl carrier protein [Nitrospinota bacterium]